MLITRIISFFIFLVIAVCLIVFPDFGVKLFGINVFIIAVWMIVLAWLVIRHHINNLWHRWNRWLGIVFMT
ncbi:MAG: hypothetical protein NTV30_02485, partial [Chloroflexi bacterium]|nr:hypothetical protein [Chloroflexota bacterium]